MPNIPTIAVKESRADLLEIGPSTGLSGFRLVYVIGKGLYRWRTGDQSGNVPGGNGGDNWIAPSEDTSGKSGAWERLTPENTTGVDGNVVTGTAGTNGNLSEWNADGDLIDGPGKTGSDANAVTGTAGTDGNLGQWNADGDLVDSSVAGSDVLVKPGTSSDPALALDTWRTPNASRLTEVELEVAVLTDGTSPGSMLVDVDQGGGTTADYSLRAGYVHNTLPANTVGRNTVSFKVPAGGSYQVRNNGDPSAFNNIASHREWTL